MRGRKRGLIELDESVPVQEFGARYGEPRRFSTLNAIASRSREHSSFGWDITIGPLQLMEGSLAGSPPL